MMKWKIYWKTRGVGLYVAGSAGLSLRAAKAAVRRNHTVRRLRWREEGGDVCAYLSLAAMADEDNAVARLRPACEHIHGAE